MIAATPNNQTTSASPKKAMPQAMRRTASACCIVQRSKWGNVPAGEAMPDPHKRALAAAHSRWPPSEAPSSTARVSRFFDARYGIRSVPLIATLLVGET